PSRWTGRDRVASCAPATSNSIVVATRMQPNPFDETRFIAASPNEVFRRRMRSISFWDCQARAGLGGLVGVTQVAGFRRTAHEGDNEALARHGEGGVDHRGGRPSLAGGGS